MEWEVCGEWDLTEHTLYVRVNDRRGGGGALRWLSIARSAGPAWPRSSSWHAALFLLLALVRFTSRARAGETDRRGRPGRRGGRGKLACEEKQHRERGRKTPMTSRKSCVNKCASEITNRARGGEIVRDKQWRGGDRSCLATPTTSKHGNSSNINSVQPERV